MQGREDIQNELLGTIIDGAPVIIVVVDGGGTITFCSDASRWMVGWEPEELVGTNILEHLDMTGASDLALDSIGSAFAAHGLRLPMQFSIKTKDGPPRVVEVTANSQMDDPIVQGMVVYIRPWNE